MLIARGGVDTSNGHQVMFGGKKLDACCGLVFTWSVTQVRQFTFVCASKCRTMGPSTQLLLVHKLIQLPQNKAVLTAAPRQCLA
jgi:hypothetical protein